MVIPHFLRFQPTLGSNLAQRRVWCRRRAARCPFKRGVLEKKNAFIDFFKYTIKNRVRSFFSARNIRSLQVIFNIFQLAMFDYHR